MIQSICTSAVKGANRAVEYAHTWGLHQVTKLKSTEQDSVCWTAAKALAVYTLVLPTLLTGIELSLRAIGGIASAAASVVQYFQSCQECESLAPLSMVQTSAEVMG